ncbi:transcriptional regulator TbsP [Halococcus sediminicola]|uniref:transcriptional regulator TbsP n=1 Tax=Halococcus sediminicola TaxID=1264579 RepID=UPI0006785C63|nr:DUF5821 family protein [Halococcus sediminicola]
MTIRSSQVRTSVDKNLRTILAEESGEIIAVDLDEDSTRELVEILAESDDPPKARLLVEEDVLKWVRDDFELASTAAELLESDILEVRAATDRLDGAVVVTGERVISLLTPDDEHSAALVTDDEEFVGTARNHRNDLWEGGEEFALRTPAYTRVLDSLGEEFSSEMVSEFRTVLESVGEMDDDELDEVDVSLLVAAKHNQLLYDISQWGEDIGVASRATFSRTKTRLEEQGLIETEKVPIEVGRPRLRLLLGDERLREADAEELASVARELLSAVPA